MGLLSKFFNFSSVSFTDWSFPSGVASSGEMVTAENSLNLAVVYACVNIKANAIAKLPLQLFQKTEKGSERVRQHKVSYLLETRPNQYMTPFQLKHLITVHRNIYGIAYLRHEVNNKGEIIAIYPLYPPAVSVLEDASGKKIYVEVTVGKENRYSEDEIIRLPYLTTDGFTAKSPIAVARESIGTLKKQQRFLGSFWQNGTLTRGVLTVPASLSKDAKEKVRQFWMDANSGESNASKIAVLDNGFDFKNITLPLQDSEFIASQKFGIEEIARIFNVPLHLVNSLDKATFSNIEQQSMDFLQNTIAPEIIAIEEELNYKLFSTNEQQSGYYVKFNLNSILRGDSTQRANYYKVMLDSGVYSINEVREKEEMNAIPNGDQHRVTLNGVSLDKADEYQINKSSN